jgi:hypothetical protein
MVLSLEVLREVMLNVRVTLNNCPLSYVEEDIESPILTPNSLLQYMVAPTFYPSWNLTAWNLSTFAS